MIGRLLGLSLWLPLKDRLFRRLFVGEGDSLLRTMLFVLAAINLAAIGPMIVALGFVPGLVSACAAAVAMGVGAGYLGVVLVSWLQERAEPALRGRVMSLVMFCVVALDPVSYALAGVLVARSLTLTFVAAGTLMLAAVLFGAASSPVRKFD